MRLPRYTSGMPHDLFFTEYCERHGLRYDDPTARDRYEAYCRHDPSKDPPPLSPPPSERAAWLLWRKEQEVAERREMRRHRGQAPVCFTPIYRVIFPKPLRIVRDRHD
jgi:hypothetical protein